MRVRNRNAYKSTTARAIAERYPTQRQTQREEYDELDNPNHRALMRCLAELIADPESAPLPGEAAEE